jgi:hypothetical protein
MAHELITSFDEFTPSALTYGAPKTNARGGKSIKIQDSRRNGLVLSTPLMLTWGVNKMIDEDTGKISYTVSLQFPSSDYAKEDTALFLEKLKQFEDQLLDDCVKNSKEWFNKPKMSREVAEALYSPMLKYPKDNATGEPDYTRAPSIRVKIAYWEGKFNTELYDMNENTIFDSNIAESVLENVSFESLIPKTSHMIACMQCNGIWFAGGKFGVTWQLVQAMIRKPVRIQGGCFIKPRSSDLKQLDEIAQRDVEEITQQEEQDDSHLEQAHMVEDSDDEDDKVESQPEPEPELIKKVKRKVVRKKKAT